MEYFYINDFKVHVPESRKALIDYAFERKCILIAVNAEKIVSSSKFLKELTNNNIGYADGFGAVIALQKKGANGVSKIPGCELWLDIVNNHYRGKKFYLVGGNEMVVSIVVERLQLEYSGIEIVGFRNGYFLDSMEKPALIADLANKKPDVVFVAMGSPEQEILMEEMRRTHPAVYQGLGGSFDLYAGQVSRAPDWFRATNLEWLYRLLTNPKRIKRQIHLLRFVFLFFRGKF